MGEETPQQQLAALFGSALPQLQHQQAQLLGPDSSLPSTADPNSARDSVMGTDDAPQTKWPRRDKDKGGSGKGNQENKDKDKEKSWPASSKGADAPTQQQPAGAGGGGECFGQTSATPGGRNLAAAGGQKNGILPKLLDTSLKWKKIQEEDKFFFWRWLWSGGLGWRPPFAPKPRRRWPKRWGGLRWWTLPRGPTSNGIRCERR